MHWTRAWLACPECGADAVESTAYGCLACGEDRDGSGCTDHEARPLWSEDDEATCPECGAELAVSIVGDEAIVEVRRG